MKRKLLTTMLALMMTASVATAMVGCGKDNGDDSHTHTFATEWTTDDTHHWKAATCEHADEVSEKAEHNWGADDKCTACQKEKVENGNLQEGEVTKTEWASSIDSALFNNVTFQYTALFTEGYSYDVGPHNGYFKLAGDNMDTNGEVTDNQDMIAVVKAWYIDTVRAIVNNFNDFEYNSSTKQYTAQKDIVFVTSIEMPTVTGDTTITAKQTVVEFNEASNIAKVTCNMTQEFLDAETQTQKKYVLNVEFVFSDYGTTVIG